LLFFHHSISDLQTLHIEGKEKTTQAVKSFPTLIQEKDPLGIGYRNLYQRKKEKIIGDQEGCSFDLKPSPNES
jgi:hypothetical protein